MEKGSVRFVTDIQKQRDDRTSVPLQTQEQTQAEMDRLIGSSSNANNEPLPLSSHVLDKVTGEVWSWNQSFAGRPDRFANCDIKGNTNPQNWQGTSPLGWGGAPSPPDIKNFPAEQSPSKMAGVYTGPVPGAVAPMHLAGEILGVDKELDYTDHSIIQAALPLAELEGGLSISDAIRSAVEDEF